MGAGLSYELVEMQYCESPASPPVSFGTQHVLTLGELSLEVKTDATEVHRAVHLTKGGITRIYIPAVEMLALAELVSRPEVRAALIALDPRHGAGGDCCGGI